MLEQLTEPITHHGEGPVWVSEEGGLHWVDLMAGDVLRFAAGTGGSVQRWHVGPVVTAIRPRQAGGYVLAGERCLALADSWAGPLTRLGPLWQEPDIRCNDAGCDPDGSFVFGSMATDYAAGRGALHRLGTDGEVREVRGGLGVPNGIDWTADGSTAYFADTLAGTIDAFDWNPEAGLHRRRRFVEVPLELGRPDGLAVDVDGCVWVALWSGGAIHRYRPDGTLDAVLEVPAGGVSACTFGGPRLDQLYITTIRGAEPESGALFRADVGVHGQPVRPYGG